MAGYNINLDDEIELYKQPTSTSCAATCAAMCVKRSPETLKEDGFNLNYVESWNAIATRYGYTSFTAGKASLTEVFDLLCQGHPVIAKINEGAKTQHWVVITRYAGSGTNPTSNQFTCADPYKGEFVTLSSAPNYVKIYATKYLE